MDGGLRRARNLIETAALIVHCARLRRESRGLHYTLDHPYRDNERFPTRHRGANPLT
jgi:L-aspartate oxidase